MQRAAQVLVALAAGIWVAACASTPGRSSAAVPLEIPEPPPRTAIAPVPLPETQVERPAPRAPAAAAAPDNPDTPAARPALPAPAAPAAASPPAAPPPVAASPPAAPADLRSGGSGTPAISAAHVREILARASQKLDALNRRQLSAGKQVDYDNARRFLSQAEAAVKSNNLMLAQSSAEKAETLADGLR